MNKNLIISVASVLGLLLVGVLGFNLVTNSDNNSSVINNIADSVSETAATATNTVNDVVDNAVEVSKEAVNEAAETVSDVVEADEQVNDDQESVVSEVVEIVEEELAIEADTGIEIENVNPPQEVVTGVGTYASYSEDRLATSDKKTVLVWSATWCPSCQALDKDINANLDQIPGDIEILKVDFDEYKNTDLGKKYSIVAQHTLVYVDENGDTFKKWFGGNTLEELVARVGSGE